MNAHKYTLCLTINLRLEDIYNLSVLSTYRAVLIAPLLSKFVRLAHRRIYAFKFDYLNVKTIKFSSF